MSSSILNCVFSSSSRIAGYHHKLGFGASPSPSSAPWLMLPPGRGSSGDILFNFYNLSEERQLSLCGGFPYGADSSIRFVGSSHGWLALSNDRTKDLFLTNPVTGRRIDLPPAPTDSIVSRVVLSSSPDDHKDDCRAVMSFVPKLDADDNGDCDCFYCANQPRAETLGLCLPVMSLGPAESLAFCCPNGSAKPFCCRAKRRSPVWSPISNGVRSYGDLVYSGRKGYLFCLTTTSFPVMNRDGGSDSIYCAKTRRPDLSDLEVWDLTDPECHWIERRHSLKNLPPLHKDSSGVSERRYLVYSEQSDQLYLIRRHMMERVGINGKFVKDTYFENRRGWDRSYPYKTVGFDVHMIDDDGRLLMDDEVSLDGVAIFIGINHGSVMDAHRFRLNSNSIYFTDDTIHTPPNKLDVDDRANSNWRFDVANPRSKWVDSSNYAYGGHDIGIFDYKNKTISPCFYPTDTQSLKRIDPPPLWFTPYI